MYPAFEYDSVQFCKSSVDYTSMKVERKIVHGYSEDQIICTWPNRNNILIVSCFCGFYTSQWEDRKPTSAVHHAWKLVVYLLILDSCLWTWHNICLKRIEGKESKESGFSSDHYRGDESRLFCTEENVLHLKYYHIYTFLGVCGRCWWDESLVGFDAVG